MNATGAHLRILLRARARALRNRFRHGDGHHPWLVAGFAIVGAAVLVVLGHFSAPGLLEAPAELAAGSAFGGDASPTAGAAALEASFWLTIVASAITSFRVMEILYRRSDIRAVEVYPIRPSALYIDRLLAALGESAVVGLAISLFFVPMVWHGAPRVAGLAGLLALTGLLASTCLSFGLQLYAGMLNVRSAESDSNRDGPSVYGGPGQLFMFSPGVALTASAVAILLVRLAVGELLGTGGVVRGFWFGFGLVAAGSVVGLAVGFRHFTADFPTISARFREADAVSYDAHHDYQESAFSSPTRLEALLPAGARPPYRALSLQYGRGHALVRYSYAIGWILGGLALAQWSRAAFPPWAVALAPAVVAATAANPWYRLVEPPLRPKFAETLPIERTDESLAALAVAARELLLLAGPYALLVAWADWSTAGGSAAILRASTALLAVLALNGAMTLSWTLAEPSRWSAFVLPLAAAVALLVLGVLSLPTLAVVSGALALLQLLPFRSALGDPA